MKLLEGRIEAHIEELTLHMMVWWSSSVRTEERAAALGVSMLRG